MLALDDNAGRDWRLCILVMPQSLCFLQDPKNIEIRNRTVEHQVESIFSEDEPYIPNAWDLELLFSGQPSAEYPICYRPSTINSNLETRANAKRNVHGSKGEKIRCKEKRDG